MKGLFIGISITHFLRVNCPFMWSDRFTHNCTVVIYNSEVIVLSKPILNISYYIMPTRFLNVLSLFQVSIHIISDVKGNIIFRNKLFYNIIIFITHVCVIDRLMHKNHTGKYSHKRLQEKTQIMDSYTVSIRDSLPREAICACANV